MKSKHLGKLLGAASARTNSYRRSSGLTSASGRTLGDMMAAPPGLVFASLALAASHNPKGEYAQFKECSGS